LLYLNKTLNLNKTITNLINLNTLFLNNNQLKEIPKEIGSLINLQYLFLNNNQLKEIPDELYNLVNCAPTSRPTYKLKLFNFYL